VKEEEDYAKSANGLKEDQTRKTLSKKTMGNMCCENSENGRGAKYVQVG